MWMVSAVSGRLTLAGAPAPIPRPPKRDSRFIYTGGNAIKEVTAHGYKKKRQKQGERVRLNVIKVVGQRIG